MKLPNAGQLKPYPEMKDSGIEWLGKVPVHWNLRRTKSLLVQRSEKGFPNEPLLAATQTKGVVRKEKYENRTVLALKDLQLLKIVRIGDFVISLRSFQGGIEFAREQGIISPAYTILYPSDRDHQPYIAKVFKSRPYIENLSLFVTGIRQGQNIDYERLARSYLPLPPLPEQTAIVRFLDHADRRIRRYIRAKQKLIALLEEQKQAIIHQAVTGQIDVRTGQPYPEYKPSGFEWIRDVPKHWEIRRLRFLIIGRLTYGANAVAEHNDTTWPRYLRITDFSKNGKLRTDTFRSLPPEIAKDYLVEPGDVLLARSGATVGKAFLVDEQAGTACHAGYLIRARLNRKLLHPALFFRFTQSAGFERWKDSTFIIATIQNISADKYANLPVPVPPRSEQENILQFVRTSEATIDRAVHRATEEIDHLREYRTRLIADVVTGKIDVREAAAELPEVDPLAEDDLDSTIHDRENSNLGEPDAEKSAAEYTIKRR